MTDVQTRQTPLEIARRTCLIDVPLASTAHLPQSQKRFPDGAHYRYEIASTEGPACLAAALTEAAERQLVIHRASQGSGVGMLSDDDIADMVATASNAGIEISLFARPTSGWGLSAQARAPLGAVSASSVVGEDGIAQALAQCVRAADLGIRSVLISDVGLLAAFSRARRHGSLPEDMQAKTSVMMPVANADAARVLEDLGADTINVQTDLPIAVLAEVRAAVDVPLDVYVEAPDTVGGFVRHTEVPELIRVAAPIYVKLGLRNAPDLYPSGSHLEATAVALSRERVRRAALIRDLLRRERREYVTSESNARGLAVPCAARPASAPAPVR